jgi:hypothetical protein
VAACSSKALVTIEETIQFPPSGRRTSALKVEAACSFETLEIGNQTTSPSSSEHSSYIYPEDGGIIFLSNIGNPLKLHGLHLYSKSTNYTLKMEATGFS